MSKLGGDNDFIGPPQDSGISSESGLIPGLAIVINWEFRSSSVNILKELAFLFFVINSGELDGLMM